MTIPNVVLGELIDPVTFGNAVVDAVNEHETEIADRLPLSGGTLTGDHETLSLRNATATGQPHIGLYHGGVRRGYLGNTTATATELSAETNQLVLDGDGARVATYLQVDENATMWQDLYVIGYANAQSDLAVGGDLFVSGTINGSLAFGIAEGVDTADLLDRAETATMPIVDDEGVATTDADVESITVNEVVTALMLKVKQLEERIEALEA